MDSTDQVFHFGDCELDGARLQLRRRGKLVPLQPRQLQLLAYLIRYRSRLVTKAELFEHLWPGVVVTDFALWTAVRGVRRALGDGRGENAIIQTRRRLGLHFAAPVRVVEVSSEA